MRRLTRLPALTVAIVAVASLLGPALPAVGQEPPASGATFTPQFAQPGKDVVWVPSPTETVELMLDVAGVTSDDFVVDLGSGDGRTIIAAAKRGARGRGVEYNPDMVALSRREALRAGVGDRVRFVQGDMYEADVSDADVLALFLLTGNLRKLSPTFLGLRPGTRIVSNTFTIPGWVPESTTRRTDDCLAWCEVLLYLVPAQVAGEWRWDGHALRLTQEAQRLEGELTGPATSGPILSGHVSGSRVTFTVGDSRYEGTLDGDTILGTRQTGSAGPQPWGARRTR